MGQSVVFKLFILYRVAQNSVFVGIYKKEGNVKNNLSSKAFVNNSSIYTKNKQIIHLTQFLFAEKKMLFQKRF
jgi:hypothetical protein